MENEEIENNELDQIVEQPTEDIVDDNTPTVDDYNALQKKLQTAIAQKEHWRSKATRSKDEVTEQKPLQTTANADDAWRQKMELKVEGFSEDEVDFILKNGGRKGLENPFVKTAIDSIRTQKQAESAVVDTDTGKSEIEKKYPLEEQRKMSVADLDKILPKAE